MTYHHPDYNYCQPFSRKDAAREQQIDKAYDEKEFIDILARKIESVLGGLETDLEFAMKDIGDTQARQRIKAMIYAISACDYRNVAQDLHEDANRVVREVTYVE